MAAKILAIAVILCLIGPLGTWALADGEFRALPLDSLEEEVVFFEKRLESGSESPLSSVERFRLLTLARSYHALGLFEISESWFLRLGSADHDGFYEEAVFNGLLLCALGMGEWERAEELLSVDHLPSVEINKDGIFRLLRHMADVSRASQALLIIDAIIEQGDSNSTAKILHYKGHLLRTQGRIEEASFYYESLLNKLKVPGNLHKSILENQDLFRLGAADTAFLLNDRIRSRQHYSELLLATDTQTRNWARFQMAQLDMLDNGYEDAESVFTDIGPDSLWEPASNWAVYLREHASIMKKYTSLLPDNRPPDVEEGP